MHAKHINQVQNLDAADGKDTEEMALVLLSKQDDYDLSHSEQDCRGWTVSDTTGKTLGKCTDMVIDTEAEHVASIILDNGTQIPAADITLRDSTVLVRGVGGARPEKNDDWNYYSRNRNDGGRGHVARD
ncbi:MAG: PRC-barrel domain-containing protein [Pyrinomonadaceae bacterium]